MRRQYTTSEKREEHGEREYSVDIKLDQLQYNYWKASSKLRKPNSVKAFCWTHLLLDIIWKLSNQQQYHWQEFHVGSLQYHQTHISDPLNILVGTGRSETQCILIHTK